MTEIEKINYQIESSCGELLDVNRFSSGNPGSTPKALVQILHGMEEHKERYDDFAAFLVKNGYDVLIHDHLGHGKSVSPAHPLGDMVSFDVIMKDIDLVRKSAAFDGRYICFGHSMGSFLARIYASIQKTDQLIACGTGQNSRLAPLVLKFLLLFQPRRTPLYRIQKLVTGPMSKTFQTPADWISYDRENQNRYLGDPLCGKPFTAEGYRVLADIIIRLNRTSVCRECTADRILLISGQDDPVGSFGIGVKIVEKKYLFFGKQVETVLYEGMTHEILNETERSRVYADVLHFLDSSVVERGGEGE